MTEALAILHRLVEDQDTNNKALSNKAREKKDTIEGGDDHSPVFVVGKCNVFQALGQLFNQFNHGDMTMENLQSGINSFSMLIGGQSKIVALALAKGMNDVELNFPIELDFSKLTLSEANEALDKFVEGGTRGAIDESQTSLIAAAECAAEECGEGENSWDELAKAPKGLTAVSSRLAMALTAGVRVCLLVSVKSFKTRGKDASGLIEFFESKAEGKLDKIADLLQVLIKVVHSSDADGETKKNGVELLWKLRDFLCSKDTNGAFNVAAGIRPTQPLSAIDSKTKKALETTPSYFTTGDRRELSKRKQRPIRGLLHPLLLLLSNALSAEDASIVSLAFTKLPVTYFEGKNHERLFAALQNEGLSVSNVKQLKSK